MRVPEITISALACDAENKTAVNSAVFNPLITDALNIIFPLPVGMIRIIPHKRGII